MKPLVCFFFVLGVAFVLTIGTALLTATQPVLRWMLFGAIWSAWCILAYFSTNRLRPDQRITALYFATFEATYASGNDYADLQNRFTTAHRLPEFTECCRRGIPVRGLQDFVYLQWPFFYDLRRVTAGMIRLRIKEATGTQTMRHEDYRIMKLVTKRTKDATGNTKEETLPWELVEGPVVNPRHPLVVPPPQKEKNVKTDGSTEEITTRFVLERTLIPRVEMQVNVDIIIRLGVKLMPLIKAVPGVSLDNPEKLGEELRNRGAEPVVQEALLHAMKKFTWEGHCHINDNLEDFEKEVVRVLRKPGTFFVEAGLLRPLHEHSPTEEREDPKKNSNGDAVESIDIAIEEPIPKSDALREALNAVAIANYNKESRRLDEFGLSSGLRDRVEMAQALGQDVTFTEVLAADAIKSSQVIAIGGDGSFLTAAAQLISGGKGQGRRTKRPRKRGGTGQGGQQGTTGS